MSREETAQHKLGARHPTRTLKIARQLHFGLGPPGWGSPKPGTYQLEVRWGLESNPLCVTTRPVVSRTIAIGAMFVLAWHDRHHGLFLIVISTPCQQFNRPRGRIVSACLSASQCSENAVVWSCCALRACTACEPESQRDCQGMPTVLKVACAQSPSGSGKMQTNRGGPAHFRVRVSVGAFCRIFPWIELGFRPSELARELLIPCEHGWKVVCAVVACDPGRKQKS